MTNEDNYHNSRPIEWLLTSHQTTLDVAIDTLLSEYEIEVKSIRRKTDRPKYYKTLQDFILNMLFNQHSDKLTYTSYDRGENTLSTMRKLRYNKTTIPAVTSIKRLTDWLDSSGRCENHIGYFSRSPFGSNGYISRIRATSDFLERLTIVLGLDSELIFKGKAPEILVMKGESPDRKFSTKNGKAEVSAKGKKPLVNYDDTDLTRTLRAQIEALNERIEPTELSLDSVDDTDALRQIKDKYLIRSFCNNSWETGGRFYNGITFMKPDFRSRLLIDGETTCELDYKALHPRMLYNMQGHECPDDPYSFEGLESVNRKPLKKGFQRLLNGHEACKTGPRIPVDQWKDGWETEGPQKEELIGYFERDHPALMQYLGTQPWKWLLKSDSDMALSIMNRMWDDHGTVVLPVHDSFIAPESMIEKLRSTMEDVYQDMFAFKPVIK